MISDLSTLLNWINIHDFYTFFFVNKYNLVTHKFGKGDASIISGKYTNGIIFNGISDTINIEDFFMVLIPVHPQ